LRAALYARVSTDEQDLRPQVESLTAYAAQRKWKITAYSDQGISGAQSSRPALDRLMAAARAGRLDVVLVWKFDRFARSTQHLLEALEVFRAHGIQFVSLTEGIDTSTAAGKMVFTFLAAVAEFERELIRERVRAGMAAARVRGKSFGRPKLRVDWRRIVKLRAQGHSWSEISRQTGIPRASCQRAFNSPLDGPPKRV
jgi:DNA invertase Pin-like site-specific DNA recombinase